MSLSARDLERREKGIKVVKAMKSETQAETFSPKVSIGLPVYNGEAYLAVAIDSVLSQSFQDWEMLIADNGSTDNTPAIINRYAMQDPRISSFRHPKNTGPAYNWNFVFRNTIRGEYFLWLSHDDVLLPEFLRVTVDILDRNSDIVLANSLQKRINEDGEYVAEATTTRQHRGFLKLNSTSSRKFRLLRMWRVVSSCGTTMLEGLIRRKTLEKTGPISENLGDLRKLIELSYLGGFHIYPDIAFLRREHASSTGRVSPQYSSYRGWWRYLGESGAYVGMSEFETLCVRLFIMGLKLRYYQRQIVRKIGRSTVVT